MHAAYHLPPGADRRAAQTLRPQHQELPPTLFGVVPKSLMWRFMRPFTNNTGVRLVNTAKYRLSAQQGHLRYRQSHVGFHFLLDYVPDWKRAYGPGGLVQFQAFVPAATARAVYSELLGRSHRAGIVPYLGVLKRHRPDPFWMTHGLDGWSLAMDFRVTRERPHALWRHCSELARVVMAAGGRFYYAKDSTLTPTTSDPTSTKSGCAASSPSSVASIPTLAGRPISGSDSSQHPEGRRGPTVAARNHP